MSKLDKDQVIEKFTQAYQSVNGKAPQIEAKGGWYSVDGGKNMRLAQLNEMADELPKGGAAKAEPAAAANKPASKKAAAKPAAKKPAKKKGGFSVKAFWKEIIGSKNKAPR